MKHLLYTAAIAAALIAADASAQIVQTPPIVPSVTAKPELKLTADGIGSDGYIDPEYAFCIPAATGHVKEGPDKSIGIAWEKGPEGTKSYAIIMVDPDVPTSFDDANQEGKTIVTTLPRRNFYHWALYDIPAEQSQIPANTDSYGIVQNGKTQLKVPYGTRGVNDFAPYFASDPKRAGVYAGYDGPCPPWNDELIHHYHLKVFALNVESLGLKEPATGAQVADAVTPHILAQSEVVGMYTLNPNVKK